MRLKLDENLGASVADIFCLAGHEVVTVKVEGLAGAGDHQIISVCQLKNRCLVTLDLDFGNPLVFDPSKYYGIAVLRLPGKPTWDDLITVCRSLIHGLSSQDIHGKLWIIQRDRIREYSQES